MGIKFQIDNDELLCLYPPDFNYKEVLKRINDYGCNIKNTFYVTKKICLVFLKTNYMKNPSVLVSDREK